MKKKALLVSLTSLGVLCMFAFVAWADDEHEEEVTLDQVPAAVKVSEENREISLFQVRLAGDNLQLWLFGRRVGEVKSHDFAA